MTGFGGGGGGGGGGLVITSVTAPLQFSAGVLSINCASTTASGVSEQATDNEVAAGTTTGGSGCPLFINPSSLFASSAMNIGTPTNNINNINVGAGSGVTGATGSTTVNYNATPLTAASGSVVGGINLTFNAGAASAGATSSGGGTGGGLTFTTGSAAANDASDANGGDTSFTFGNRTGTAGRDGRMTIGQLSNGTKSGFDFTVGIGGDNGHLTAGASLLVEQGQTVASGNIFAVVPFGGASTLFGVATTGGFSATGASTITGSADVVQLTVKGNGTQTYSNPIVSIQNSNGTKLFQFTTLNGDATMGTLYFGNIVPSAANTNYSMRGDGSNLIANATNNIELRINNGADGRLLFDGNSRLLSDGTFQYKAGAASDVGFSRAAAGVWNATNGDTSAALYINASGRIYGNAVSAPTFSSGSVTSNVATINTTAAHNLATGQVVTITGSAGVAVNGTYIVTVVDADTFTFNKTVGNGTITAATITPLAVLQLGAAPTTPPPSGDVIIACSGVSQTGLIVQGKASQTAAKDVFQVQTSTGVSCFQVPVPNAVMTGTANFLGGSQAGRDLTSGAQNILIGSAAGRTITTGGQNTLVGDSNAITNVGDSGACIFGQGNQGADNCVIIGHSITSTTNNDFIIRSGDTGLTRIAANVVGANDGTNAGWFQNTPGTKRLTAQATNATNTMSNLTDLSITVTAGRKYTGFLLVYALNSTAAEGLKFDFGGGSCSATSTAFGFVSTPGGVTLGTITSTALTTAITATTATTGDSVYLISFAIVVSGGGTLIPRFAENSAHVAGTATVELNSFFTLDDSAN